MSIFKIIVPAKGNSLRVPKKNLKKFGSKRLIDWTLEPLLNSKIGEIIVSSESSEVLDYVSKYNVSLHFRPKELSLPTVHSSLAVFDAAKKKCDDDNIVGVALPTIPFREPKTIENIKKFFLLNTKRSLVSVVSLRVTKNHLIFKGEDGIFEKFNNKYNFQDNESSEMFALSGYLQLAKFKYFKKKKSFHLLKPIFFEVPFEEALDINTNEDFDFASKLAENKKKLN